MFKPFFAAFTAASVLFAIVAGCSSSNESNGSTKRNRSSGDDDDDDNGKPKTSSSSSSGASVECSSLPASDPRPACDECVKAKCCEEYAACEKETACKANKKCVEDCESGDIGCLLICANSPGADTAQTFGICVGNQCNDECPDTSGAKDGGLDFGDAF
ncbi:MAG: hypothetical protein KIT84_21625 [Labilithrix sp.]|nr:hypothetical protein [Labilithrix sp.]MCW5813644.1 hypothetical protein [Labilithrix sp.]